MKRLYLIASKGEKELSNISTTEKYAGRADILSKMLKRATQEVLLSDFEIALKDVKFSFKWEDHEEHQPTVHSSSDKTLPS